jgi:hypothetical protein
VENATCLGFVLIIYDEITVTCYMAQTNHCYLLQGRHKPMSTVTGHTQTNVNSYRADTNQCNLLRGRNRAHILAYLTNIQPTSYSHSNAQMHSLFRGNYTLLIQHASLGAGVAELASGLGYGLDDRGIVF